LSNRAVLEPSSKENVFSYTKWGMHLATLREQYRNAQPFPHVVLENFLENYAAEEALAEFPSVNSGDWIHYIHINEKKFGKTNLATFEPTLSAIVDELNSSRFLQFLSELTDIKGLFADHSLEGGGLHQTGPGGFLNIHADFTVHPHHRNWERRVNILIYLNKEWKHSYRGYLELWDRNMRRRVKKIAPIFNRCVIFNTDPDAFHGHPSPLACPEGMTRKSIALYYFTKDSRLAPIRSTNYKARPYDGIKRFLIYFDKKVLQAYDATKRKLRINDRFASAILRSLHNLNARLMGKQNRHWNKRKHR